MVPPSHPGLGYGGNSSSGFQPHDFLPVSVGISFVPTGADFSPSPAPGVPLHADHTRQNCFQPPVFSASADFSEKQAASSAAVPSGSPSHQWQHERAFPPFKPAGTCSATRRTQTVPSCGHADESLPEQRPKAPTFVSELKESLYPPGFEPREKPAAVERSMDCSKGYAINVSWGMQPKSQPCTLPHSYQHPQYAFYHPHPERSSQASYQGFSYPTPLSFSRMPCQDNSSMCGSTSFLSSYLPNYEMHDPGGTVIGVPALNAQYYVSARPMFEGLSILSASNNNTSQYSRNAFKFTKYFRGNHLHPFNTDRELHSYKWYPSNVPGFQQSHFRPVTESLRYNTGHSFSIVETKLPIPPSQIEKDLLSEKECKASPIESSQSAASNERMLTDAAKSCSRVGGCHSLNGEDNNLIHSGKNQKICVNAPQESESSLQPESLCNTQVSEDRKDSEQHQFSQFREFLEGPATLDPFSKSNVMHDEKWTGSDESGNMAKVAHEKITEILLSTNDKFKSAVPLNTLNRNNLSELHILHSKIQPSSLKNIHEEVAEQSGEDLEAMSRECRKLMAEAEAIHVLTPVQQRELDKNDENIHRINSELCNIDINEENSSTENMKNSQSKITKKELKENQISAEETTKKYGFENKISCVVDQKKNIAAVSQDKSVLHELKTRKGNKCNVHYMACNEDANTVVQKKRIKTTVESEKSNDSNTEVIENGMYCDIINVSGNLEQNVKDIDNTEDTSCDYTEKSLRVSSALEVEHDVVAAESMDVINHHEIRDPDSRCHVLENISQKNFSGCSYKVKRSGSEFSTVCKRYKYDHLESSTGNDASKEKSYLLQCCRFIVNNSFLQQKSPVGLNHFLWLETKETNTSDVSCQTMATENSPVGEILKTMSNTAEIRDSGQNCMQLNSKVSDIGEDPDKETASIFVKQRSGINNKDGFEIDGLTEDALLSSVLLQNFTDKEEQGMILGQSSCRDDSQLAYKTDIRGADYRIGLSYNLQPSIITSNDTQDQAITEGFVKASQSSALRRSCDVENDNTQACSWKLYYDDIDEYQSHGIMHTHCNSLKESNICNGSVTAMKYMSKCVDAQNLIPCLLEQHYETNLPIVDINNQDTASAISVVDDEDDISQYINFDLHGTDSEISCD